eukprot:423814-Hanusia_phi.AAC.4
MGTDRISAPGLRELEASDNRTVRLVTRAAESQPPSHSDRIRSPPEPRPGPARGQWSTRLAAVCR